MSTPDPFDPDDPDTDPWADDPLAPKEPGIGAAARGPAALLDPETRGRIEHEILYQQTKAALAVPPPDPPRRSAVRLLLPFAAGLVGGALLGGGPRLAGLVGVVVLAHGLGHLAGMLVFGLRDWRAVFAPFPGTGADEPVAAWKRAVTALLGPLPGVVGGFVIAAVVRPPAGEWLADLGLLLVILNAVALLPIVPLDGGRLLDLLGPTRRPGPGTAVRAAVAVALGGAAAFAGDWPIAVAVGAAAGLVLLATPGMHRHARSRGVLRQVLPGLPVRVADLTDAQQRKVFEVALIVFPVPDPDRLAAVGRDLHARAAARAAGPAVSAVLLLAYLLGAAAVAGYAWVAA